MLELPVTNYLLSGEKLAIFTVFKKWIKILIFVYDLASHIIASLSSLPVTMNLPSGEKLQVLIYAEWPSKSFPI